MARKKVRVDWELADKLFEIQCTCKEVAHVLGVGYNTLVRRCEEEHMMPLEQYAEERRAPGKMSLRRRQFEMAEKNVAMAIWLGKQYLGQSDKQENQVTGHDNGPVQIIFKSGVE